MTLRFTAEWPTRISFIAALTLFCATTGLASAQSALDKPESENGRYTMSPIADGVLRLDTRSGAMSICAKSGAGWACSVMPDERAAFDTEVGRLQNEIIGLKTQLAMREPTTSGKTDEALPKQDPLKPANPPKVADGQRKIEIPLPSDQDIDQALTFLGHAWRRLVDMANRFQSDTSGKI